MNWSSISLCLYLACATALNVKHGNVSTSETRVFVVVLGHGEEARSQGLSATLHSFYEQLGPENFDCLVFVWNPDMRLPDVPPGCEIKVTPGVFMEYTALIPEDRLQAARYAYLMADDVTLDVPNILNYSSMDIAALRDVAAENCVDAITPAHYGSDRNDVLYGVMKSKQHKRPGVVGRLLFFLEFQGVLVSPIIVHLLSRLASAGITGCWGYDSLLYSATKKWTGRLPRIGIADNMEINVGKKSLSGPERITDNPCGKVARDKNGNIVHVSATDQIDHWLYKSGLVDYKARQVTSIGDLKGAPPGRTKQKAECSRLLAPGDLSLLGRPAEFAAWLHAVVDFGP